MRCNNELHNLHDNPAITICIKHELFTMGQTCATHGKGAYAKENMSLVARDESIDQEVEGLML